MKECVACEKEAASDAEFALCLDHLGELMKKPLRGDTLAQEIYVHDYLIPEKTKKMKIKNTNCGRVAWLN